GGDAGGRRDGGGEGGRREAGVRAEEQRPVRAGDQGGGRRLVLRHGAGGAQEDGGGPRRPAARGRGGRGQRARRRDGAVLAGVRRPGDEHGAVGEAAPYDRRQGVPGPRGQAGSGREGGPRVPAGAAAREKPAATVALALVRHGRAAVLRRGGAAGDGGHAAGGDDGAELVGAAARPADPPGRPAGV